MNPVKGKGTRVPFPFSLLPLGRRLIYFVLVSAVCVSLSISITHAQIIDRVLAVVDGQIITLSDVRAALTFSLVPADTSDDPIGAALRRVIDRRLMLAEVERYATPEPPQNAVDAGVAAVQARFPDAPAFEVALSQSAMSRDQLRRYIGDSLRIDTYVQQRFSSAAEPSDDDVARYYKDHLSEFTAEGVPRPLSEVREEVRTRIAAERRASVISEWLDGLYRRSSIVELYEPGR